MRAASSLRLHIGVACGLTHYMVVGGCPQHWLEQSLGSARSSLASAASVTAGTESPLPSSSALRSLSTVPSPSTGPSSSAVWEHQAGGSRWEFLAAGSAFRQLKSVVKESGTGQVVCSGEVWGCVSGHDRAAVTGCRVTGKSRNWLVTACKGSTSAAPLGTAAAAAAAAVVAGSGAGTAAADGGTTATATATGTATTTAATGTDTTAGANGDAALSALTGFLMPALLCRSRVGLSSRVWLGEYRQAVVLFVLLPSPDECGGGGGGSVGSWLAGFQALFVSLQAPLLKVGGQVRQLLVDDKGCVLIGAFGLPPLAHEDDATRAVACALEMLATVHKQHVHAADMCSIGVTTGRVWCGAVGSEARKEYTLVGNTVNTSARIMAHAVTRGRVMVDEETRRECAGRILFHPTVQRVQVKGKAEPITLYEPLSKAGVSAAPSPHSTSPPQPSSPRSFRSVSLPIPTTQQHSGVDKDSSRQRTRAALVATLDPGTKAAGEAAVVVLEAGAGQGKTYMTAWLIDHFTAAGVSVLRGAADSMETLTPFYAIAPILRAVIQHGVDASQLAKRALSPHAVLLSLLPPSDHPYVSWLCFLLPECASETSVVAESVEMSVRPLIVRRLMRALIDAHCKLHPLTLLVVDDGHWLDNGSMMLLRELTETLSHVRLLLTCRPVVYAETASAEHDSCAAHYSAIVCHRRCHRFSLLGMDSEATTALAASCFGCKSLSASLAADIYQRSDGIPLFVRHLCSYMLDSELVSVSKTTAQAAFHDGLLADAALPGSLEGLLTSILDRLHPHYQLTLKVASVVGRHFLCSLVASCHPTPLTRSELQTAMDMAERQTIVLPDKHYHAQPLPTVEAHQLVEHYWFTHQVMRDAAYSSLLFEQRRELHAKVADHLSALRRSEKLPAAANDGALRFTSAQLIAQHYWLSLCSSENELVSEPDQRLLACSIDHLLLAASDSQQLGLLDDVAQLLKKAARALQLVAGGQQRDMLQLRLLSTVLGTQLVSNPPLLVGLAIVSDDAQPSEEITHELFDRCKRTMAERLLALASSPSAAAELSQAQIDDCIFVALYNRWGAAWSIGPSAVRAALDRLTEFVQSSVGEQREYYELETLLAAFRTHALQRNLAGQVAAFAAWREHPLYLRAKRGETKLTRFALGSNPLADMVPVESMIMRTKGYCKTADDLLLNLVQLLRESEHQPSIKQGWMHIAGAIMEVGPEPLIVSLLQQAVAVLPSEDSKANHLPFMVRQCGAMALRVWLSEPSGGKQEVEYETDMLALIEWLSGEGAALGVQFYVVVHHFPFCLGFHRHVPLSVHRAMLQLLDKYAPLFGHVLFMLNIHRSRAQYLIRQLQAGVGNREQLAEEAEALLMVAERGALATRREVVSTAETYRLKLQITWFELRLATGRREEAVTELKKVWPPRTRRASSRSGTIISTPARCSAARQTADGGVRFTHPHGLVPFERASERAMEKQHPPLARLLGSASTGAAASCLLPAAQPFPSVLFSHRHRWLS